MEEQKTIKDYIVDYLLDGEDEKRLDPVLVEWLAEDESHRKEFNLYKKIWEESHRYTEVEAFDPDLAWEKVDKINRKHVIYGFRGCRIFVDSVSFVFYGNFSERIGGSGQYECRLWESFGDHVAGWIFGQVERRF